jgi:hypothetical protein
MEISDLISILVEQNKSFIEQNKNYKDILVFTVGSIITLLVIFLTANFFTMRKIRQDEIEKIKSELYLSLKTETLPKLEEDIKSTVDSLVETKFNSLESKISSLESKINLINYDLKKKEKKDYELEGMLYNLQAEVDIHEEVYENAFLAYLEAGNAFLKADSGHIDSLLRSMEQTARKMDFIYSEVVDFQRFASELDEEYQAQANKILQILINKNSD